MGRFTLPSLLAPAAAALLVGLALAPLPSASAKAADDLAAATAAGQPAFVVVIDATAKGVEAVLAAAQEAAAAVGGASVVRLDRGAAENADLVRSYRVGSAPVPLVLVLARNGFAVAGLTADKATAAALAAAVPTPKKLDTLMAFSEKRAVFVVVSDAKMTGRLDTVEQASLAVAAMETTKFKGRVVNVDLADAGEAAFVKELALGEVKAPTVVVFNGAGKRITTLRAPVTAAGLTEQAVKAGCSCCEDGVCGHGK